jgi:hypothetical protein
MKTRLNARNYNGVRTTSHQLTAILPKVLTHISANFKDRPDLIMAAWPSLIGPKLAPMTQAVSFERGVLTVRVKNSTLYSLLSQKDKPKLIQALRAKFPQVMIKTILFRIG